MLRDTTESTNVIKVAGLKIEISLDCPRRLYVVTRVLKNKVLYLARRQRSKSLLPSRLQALTQGWKEALF